MAGGFIPNNTYNAVVIVNNDLPLFTNLNDDVQLPVGYLIEQRVTTITNLNVQQVQASYNLNNSDNDFLYNTCLVCYNDGSIVRVLESAESVASQLFTPVVE
jgi:hypothetical protein